MRSSLESAALLSFVSLVLSAAACGGTPSGSSDGATGGTSSGGATATGGQSTGGTGAGGQSTGGAGAGGQSTGGDGGAGQPIGECSDPPGACPPDSNQVDLHDEAALASASRGEDAYANDPPDTCYLVHNGTYSQSGVLLYFKRGGVPGGARRIFVGESRTGVIIHGRASVDDGVGDLTISNMTLDLTGYSQAGSFNTVSLGTGQNITLDHLTLTGDCLTGNKGGHIETNGTSGVLVECCLIEKFGACGPAGHEDHGIYLASGSDITIRDNVIRQNSSRGIQLYTAGGDYGTLDSILIEGNRIHENGHGDYEDGIVINGTDTGTISDVTIRRNLIYRNHYSGVRFVGAALANIQIEKNTFDSNGAGSSSDNRSEINLDDQGSGASTVVTGNILHAQTAILNSCYDAASRGFTLQSNFVSGAVPTGADGDCVEPQTEGDPQFTDAANGDYHTENPAAAGFGAYAP